MPTLPEASSTRPSPSGPDAPRGEGASGKLEAAFVALARHDWGSDPRALEPIDVALRATRDRPEALRPIQARLSALLGSEVPVAAVDWACRRLGRFGTGECVAALAPLLGSKELSHRARGALERIPGGEPLEAMRGAIGSIAPQLRVGVILSLGARRDEKSVPVLGELLGKPPVEVAAAAAVALGSIGTRGAAAALGALDPKACSELRAARSEGGLQCAERLFRAGEKEAAVGLWKLLDRSGEPEHVRAAAKRGLALAGRAP